jgi:hypothetical protein
VPLVQRFRRKIAALRAVQANSYFSAILRPVWGQTGGLDAVFPCPILVNCGGARTRLPLIGFHLAGGCN